MTKLQTLLIKHCAVLELLNELYKNARDFYLLCDKSPKEYKDMYLQKYLNYSQFISDVQNYANELKEEIDVEESKEK